MQYNQRFRLIVRIGLLLVAVLTVWSIYNWFAHRGDVGVEIETVPGDAQVLLDGEKLSSSKPYIEPGTYTFSATKDGFEKATREITISSTSHYVGLVLSPVSEDAQKWAADNQDAYEDVGTQIVDERVDTVEDKNPLLAKLPYIDVMGPFAIDYEFSSETSYDATIVIRNSTPNGRLKALQWIRTQDIDPADLTIRFEDFSNPTNQGDY